MRQHQVACAEFRSKDRLLVTIDDLDLKWAGAQLSAVGIPRGFQFVDTVAVGVVRCFVVDRAAQEFAGLRTERKMIRRRDPPEST